MKLGVSSKYFYFALQTPAMGVNHATMVVRVALRLHSDRPARVPAVIDHTLNAREIRAIGISGADRCARAHRR